MKLKLFLPAALLFGLVNPSISSVPHKTAPQPPETKAVPFEAYWDARSWDMDGSDFWTAKEAPLQESA